MFLRRSLERQWPRLVVILCLAAVAVAGIVARERAEKPRHTRAMAPSSPDEDARRADQLVETVDGLRKQAKYVDAVPIAKEIASIQRRRHGAEHSGTVEAEHLVRTLKHIASLPVEAQVELAEADQADARVAELYVQGKYSEAIDVTRRQLSTRRRFLGDTSLDIANSLSNLGALLLANGEPTSAEAFLREALAMVRSLLGEEHPRVATSIDQLAQVLSARGNPVDAEPLYREALAVRRRSLGSEHSDVASSLNNLAAFLQGRGRYAQAEPLFREALAIWEKMHGAEHPDVATAVDNLALLLTLQGDFDEAERLYHRVLAMRRALFGNEHPDVAITLNKLAGLLYRTGRYAEAESLYLEALDARRKVLGEGHPRVASTLNSLAALYDAQGRVTAAQRAYHEALAVWRAVYGDEHPNVATTLNNLGLTFKEQGDYARAEQLYREALAIRRQILGDDHPDVAQSLDNLALLLSARGSHAEAQELLERGLGILRRKLGEHHPDVGQALSNLGHVLRCMGDHKAAERSFRKALAVTRSTYGREHRQVAACLDNLGVTLMLAGDREGAELPMRDALAMRRRVFGEMHADVAVSLHNMAALMKAQNNYAEAERLWQEALTMRREILGGEHPAVADSLNALADLYYLQGDFDRAEQTWAVAADVFEVNRLWASPLGLERIMFASERSPLARLAACLARNGKPRAAWNRLEAHFARGLLDAVSSRRLRRLEPDERGREDNLVGRIERIDERLATVARDTSEHARAVVAELRGERDRLRAELLRFELELTAKRGVAAGEVFELGHVQEQLSPDTALITWLDVQGQPEASDPTGEHWGCVVRRDGEPAWVRLPGTGDGGAWTTFDDQLAALVRRTLSQRAEARSVNLPELLQGLGKQRLTPLMPHLGGVRRLIVLPAGWMAGVPVESITDRWTVCYAPSGTMYAWLVGEVRADELTQEGNLGRLLALGDPVFVDFDVPAPMPDLPEGGVFIASVVAGSNAALAGVRRGDVVLSYDGTVLQSGPQLAAAIQQHKSLDNSRSDSRVPVAIWRNGHTLEIAVAPGRLGVRPSERSAAETVRMKWGVDTTLRSTRGATFARLPGSRHEVQAIAEIFERADHSTKPTVLLGTVASEQSVQNLAATGRLADFRYLHFATHALIDDRMAMQSALILSQDQRTDPLEAFTTGTEVFDGRVTAEQIVRTWRLNAELVTLSACETALGEHAGGEGFLGFSQALFVAGARSLLLSLWKVDDRATALLMTRFYANLMGTFASERELYGRAYSPGQKMPKAEALGEARQWLRTLSPEQGRQALGVSRLRAFLGGQQAGGDPVTLTDFSDPFYWAAFVLIGSPD